MVFPRQVTVDQVIEQTPLLEAALPNLPISRAGSGVRRPA